MNGVDEFLKLLPVHEAGLILMHNEHRGYHETAAEAIWGARFELALWPSEEAKQRAINLDSIWSLQWYPRNSVGFNLICAPTLTELMEFLKTV